jgi:hypothetical protein
MNIQTNRQRAAVFHPDLCKRRFLSSEDSGSSAKAVIRSKFIPHAQKAGDYDMDVFVALYVASKACWLYDGDVCPYVTEHCKCLDDRAFESHVMDGSFW